VSGPGEPVTAWARTSSVCRECSTTFDGCSCPKCGERPDAYPVSAFGRVSERGDGSWLTIVEPDGSGWTTRSERSISDEQVGWLRRQGDVR
jgi:hypothetical protein